MASLLFCAPSGWGLVGFFLYVIFGFASLCDVFASCGLVCLFVRFGLFTAFFVESLILAQDERWRRA